MKILTKSQNFQWISEGVPAQKRGKKIRYEAFVLGDLKIEIGDFVLVRNDDALDPEDFMSCYVAQVKNLFDTGDEFDPYQAQVQWFSRVLELPTYAIKLFKSAGHELEVVKDTRSSWHDTVDAETIFQKCEVIFLPFDCDFESALSKYKNLSAFNTPVFFCRYIFTGTSLIEVKDNLKVNAIMASSTNGNSSVNGSISHDEKTTVSDTTRVKSRSPVKTRETYCAFTLGSPSKIPRVVIKKIDEKILESRNKNVRIFIADSDAESIEDVANTFLNKLKLEEENNLENKPVIHNLTSQKDNQEKDIIVTDTEFMDYDSSVESEASNTPQKLSNRKCSIKLNTKFCKNIFTYNTRNSPKKHPSVKFQNMCTTPTKKPKITMLNDLRFKLSSPKMTHATDEDILKPRLGKNKHKSLDKQYDTDIAEKCKFKNDDKFEVNGHSVSDEEIDPLSMSFHKDILNPRLGKNKHNLKKQPVAEISKFKNDDKCEANGHSVSDMEIDPLSTSIRTRKSSMSKVTASPAHKSIKKTGIDAEKALPNKFVKLENSDSYFASKKKEAPDTKKSSPSKYIKVENSSSYSTPKKTAKFADGFEEFHQTRSGRRVKAVNYTEEKNATSLISATTPTKKVPRYVHINYSDDSDSDNFAASSHSSDDDDSLSDINLLDEVSPHKTKKSLKKKIASKKTGNNLSIRTPKSRKNLINLSIPERKTPLRTPKNALEESRQRLHVSAVPNSLPCRDEEYSDIYSFVKGCLCAQTGGCMYISGVPGTGKTATVHEVIRNLEEEKELGEVPIFNFVEVNGMWMTDPYQCYVQIFKLPSNSLFHNIPEKENLLKSILCNQQEFINEFSNHHVYCTHHFKKSLTGKGIAPQQAADLLEKRFTERGPKKDAVVLLVDELDRLWTRKQTVMYNLFDWPSKKNSKLIVLAIANTMDLPERMMMNRISSRLGLTRKTFQPYTFKQLQEIIMSRIQELKVFDPDAVQLVARKVAAVSGDARRALDICRFATETVKVGQTVKKGQKILVGMEHVDKALQQMFSSPVISAIRSSSKITKLFFQCILSEFTRSGLEETTLLKVHQQVISTCRFEGLNPPNSTEISRICADLAASHLILVDNFKNDLYMKIRLNISSDDVTYALTLK